MSRCGYVWHIIKPRELRCPQCGEEVAEVTKLRKQLAYADTYIKSLESEVCRQRVQIAGMVRAEMNRAASEPRNRRKKR